MKYDEYKCCSYCHKMLKDCQSTFFFEHIKDKKHICTDKDCMYKYLLETHSRMNLIVSK